MSPAEMTHAALLRLLRDLARDQEALSVQAAEAGRLQQELELGGNGPRQAALALALHHWYTALETALSRVTRALEGDVPQGPDWHLALLENAAQPLQPLRPALLEAEQVAPLGELRRFRHFLRNAYAVELDVKRLCALADLLGELQPGVARSLGGVALFLEALRQRLEAE